MTSSRTTTRALTAARLGWAAVLLLAPASSLRGAGVPSAAVARVLGVRHLAQALLATAAPRPVVQRGSALVDAVHTGSCLVVAAVSPRWRRAALVDAVIEAGFAGVAGRRP